MIISHDNKTNLPYQLPIQIQISMLGRKKIHLDYKRGGEDFRKKSNKMKAFPLR